MDIAALLRLLPFAACLVGGGVASWGVRGWMFESFERPAIVRETQAADAAIYEKAALEAKRALELRNFKVIEQLTDHFYQQQAEDTAWQQAQLLQLNQEIADYERSAAGDGDGLTQHDLDFLGGVLAQPAPAHQ